MRRLLLVSSSAKHGTRYLEHCEPQIVRLLGQGQFERVLFVPYALSNWDGYAAKARDRFHEIGLAIESIHDASNPRTAVEAATGIFIGGGNTFRLLKTLWDQDLLGTIRQRVLDGMPYLGTSAGSNVACPTIMTTNDMPIVSPPGLAALDLVSFQINAHYLDPDPQSTHMGESRDTRLHEYHEENDTPVVALREGAMLNVNGEEIVLEGSAGGKLFRRGLEPLECPPETRIDRLLASDS